MAEHRPQEHEFEDADRRQGEPRPAAAEGAPIEHSGMNPAALESWRFEPPGTLDTRSPPPLVWTRGLISAEAASEELRLLQARSQRLADLLAATAISLERARQAGKAAETRQKPRRRAASENLRLLAGQGKPEPPGRSQTIGLWELLRRFGRWLSRSR